MASGTVKKDILITQSQFYLPSSVTIGAGQRITLLDAVNISTLTLQALDPVPSGLTLKGAVMLYTTDSRTIGTDVLVADGNKVSVQVLNPSTSSVTVDKIRFLLFWE